MQAAHQMIRQTSSGTNWARFKAHWDGRFHELEDSEIQTFVNQAGWNDEWMAARITPRGKAKARAAAPVNASNLLHAVPTPARMVPMPKAAVTRPVQHEATTNETATGHGATEETAAAATAEGAATGEGAAAATNGESQVTGLSANGENRDGAAGNEEPEQPLTEPLEAPCMICHNQMSEVEQELTTLQCGHLVHTNCVQAYMQVSRKPMHECCPYRCHQSSQRTIVPLAEHQNENVPEVGIVS